MIYEFFNLILKTSSFLLLAFKKLLSIILEKGKTSQSRRKKKAATRAQPKVTVPFFFAVISL